MMSSSSAPAPVPDTFYEEDRIPNYQAEHFYPAYVGEQIDRYRLISKLGWGTHSTVWLAHKKAKWFWQSDRHVALKITNNDHESKLGAKHELEVSRHLKAASAANGTHHWIRFVRLVEDSFTVEGPNGESHLVLAFEPLRESMNKFSQRLDDGRGPGLPFRTMKPCSELIAHALAFIHAQNVVHTDLKCDNFLVHFEKDNVLPEYIQTLESSSPPITKTIQGHTIITKSQAEFGPLRKSLGRMKLIDFGLSVTLEDPNQLCYDPIQPVGFEAPEVLFDAGWNKSADIWNFAIMLWELLQNMPLVLGINFQTGEYSRALHVAQLHRLLGPPPKALLDRARPGGIEDLYDAEGTFKHEHLIPPPTFTLASHTYKIANEDQEAFLKFAARLLKWMPEDRPTAEELLKDPFFQ